jgi:hypothetical protein
VPSDSVNRAKQLLASVRHAAMATVNEDGSPHNTPYRFLADENLEYLYWGSHPDSLHSQNVARTGEVFIVMYEANESGGLYIKANKAHELGDTELVVALEVHNNYRHHEGKPPISVEYYTSGPQKMYRAKIANFYVNSSEKNERGEVLRDYRKEITRKDLLA